MQRTRGDHWGPSQTDMGSSQSQSRHSSGQRPGNGTLLGCCSGTGFLSRPWPAIIIREPPDCLTTRLIVTCAMVWIKKHRHLAPKKACTAVHPLCSHCLRMFHVRSYTLKSHFPLTGLPEPNPYITKTKQTLTSTKMVSITVIVQSQQIKRSGVHHPISHPSPNPKTSFQVLPICFATVLRTPVHNNPRTSHYKGRWVGAKQDIQGTSRDVPSSQNAPTATER